MKGFQIFVASMLLIALITIGLFNANLVITQSIANNFTVVDIAGRQRQLIERYVKEVLLYT